MVEVGTSAGLFDCDEPMLQKEIDLISSRVLSQGWNLLSFLDIALPYHKPHPSDSKNVM